VVRRRVRVATFFPYTTLFRSEHLLVLALHGLPRGRDAALDVVLARVPRVLEHDDVAGVGLTQPRQPDVRERDLGPVLELVHEQELARPHRSAPRSCPAPSAAR